jgi:hypothetical protein
MDSDRDEDNGPNIVNLMMTPDQRVARFWLNNCSVKEGALFRETILASIPILAFSNVDIIQNTTNTSDAHFATKLHTLPIESRYFVDDMCLPNTCTACNGTGLLLNTQHPCFYCGITFVLDERCPESEAFRCITSSDLTMHEHHDQQLNVIRPFENVPLMTLYAGESVHFVCRASKNIGKHSMRWSPSYAVAVRPLPVVTFDSASINNVELITNEERATLVRSCRTGVFQMDKVMGIVGVEDATRCNHCGDCQKPGNIGALYVRTERSERVQIAHVESTGVLDMQNMLQKTLLLLKQSLANV